MTVKINYEVDIVCENCLTRDNLLLPLGNPIKNESCENCNCKTLKARTKKQ